MMKISNKRCKSTKLSGLELETDHNDICNMPALVHDITIFVNLRLSLVSN